MRLLDPSLIPLSLWESDDGVLALPPALATAYCDLVERCGLRDLAAARDRENPPVGGLTQVRADEHFAQAFDGSAARAQLVLLDPHDHVADASDAFVKVLAGNRLCITDAPCGAGAAAFAFLTSVAELRAQRILPRLPLHVDLIGAELSEPSREYARQLFARIEPALKEQAIFATHTIQLWNVTDALTNTDLIRRMTIASAGRTSRLLVVANFNGFLEKERKRDVAKPQLEELFRHASGPDSLALWIEPAMNRAIGSGGLFTWLRTLANGAWRLFVKERATATDHNTFPTSTARFREPLQPEITARVGLAVLRFDLERRT